MLLLRYTKASDTAYKVLEVYTKTAIVEADKATTSLVRTTLFLYTLKYYYPSSGTGGGGGKKAAPLLFFQSINAMSHRLFFGLAILKY